MQKSKRRKPGAGGGTRTPTGVSPGDFESPSSADSDTPAVRCREYRSICEWTAQGRGIRLRFGVETRAIVIVLAAAGSVVASVALGLRIWRALPILGECL